jgi:type II secretory ATPase GspE/PulE/Tfp pilus assembly ATPase PilB-like protein
MATLAAVASSSTAIANSQSELTEKFEDAKNYFTGKTVTLYEGKGCDACSHTGYKGRLAVFEFIKVTPPIFYALS